MQLKLLVPIGQTLEQAPGSVTWLGRKKSDSRSNEKIDEDDVK